MLDKAAARAQNVSVMRTTDRQRLGQAIKAQRDVLGLSQERLAARAGLTTRTVARAEAGLSIRSTTLECIGEALGVSVAELWAGVAA